MLKDFPQQQYFSKFYHIPLAVCICFAACTDYAHPPVVIVYTYVHASIKKKD